MRSTTSHAGRTRGARAPRAPLGLAGAAALAMAAAGCGSSGGATESDAGDLFSCAGETRAAPYAPNLTRASASGTWQIVLVAGDPAPPARGDNTWTVKVLDATGAPQDDLSMTAAPFMPDHRHPSMVKPAVTPLGGGAYAVTPVYLFMPGYWEITFKLHPADAAADAVVFPICIPG
jgi:hypothetical protein